MSTSPNRAARRRMLRAAGKLDQVVAHTLKGDSPTAKFGRGLDEWAASEGRRIKVGRIIRLGKWRSVVIFKAEK